MTKKAHLLQDWRSKGDWTDTAVYRILHDEWHPLIATRR